MVKLITAMAQSDLGALPCPRSTVFSFSNFTKSWILLGLQANHKQITSLKILGFLFDQTAAPCGWFQLPQRNRETKAKGVHPSNPGSSGNIPTRRSHSFIRGIPTRFHSFQTFAATCDDFQQFSWAKISFGFSKPLDFPKFVKVSLVTSCVSN